MKVVTLVGKTHDGFIILAQKPASMAPKEPLSVVLGVNVDQEAKYVTWIYNTSPNDFSAGNHFSSANQALIDFSARNVPKPDPKKKVATRRPRK